MGIVRGTVVFDGSAPDLSRIADAITSLTGLSVTTTASPAEAAGGVHAWHGRIVFDCVPEEPLVLYAYNPGPVADFFGKSLGDVGRFTAPFVEGMNEKPGTQAVYLEGYVGQDPTLMMVASLALESLGGKLAHEFDAMARQRYGRALSVDELMERRRKNKRRILAGFLLLILMFPVVFPLQLLSMLWFLVAMPWRIYKAGRVLSRSNRKGRSRAPWYPHKPGIITLKLKGSD